MTALRELLDEELAKQDVDVCELGENDLEFAAAAIRSLVTGLKTRTRWQRHVGGILTRSQVLELTTWSEQALSQAVADHRVLRLESDGSHAYLLGGLDDQSPARPLPGIDKALKAWAAADPRGWAAASWLMSPEPELGGRTPRDALMARMSEQVAVLAERAVARLAV